MKILLNIKSKKMIFWVILIVVISVLIYFPVHQGILRSAPYKLSEEFILKNDRVVAVLGNTLRCKLNIFTGYSLMHHKNHSGSYEDASFDINVMGTRGKGLVKIELEKRDKEWKIVTAILYDKQGIKIMDLLSVSGVYRGSDLGNYLI